MRARKYREDSSCAVIANDFTRYQHKTYEKPCCTSRCIIYELNDWLDTELDVLAGHQGQARSKKGAGGTFVPRPGLDAAAPPVDFADMARPADRFSGGADPGGSYFVAAMPESVMTHHL